MKIGILSDSHGDTRTLKAGVEAMISRHVEMIVHCGDVGSTDCIAELAGAGLPVYMVLGNADHRAGDLKLQAEALGVSFQWEAIQVPISADKHLAVTHGHDGRILNDLIQSGQFAYVCHGHTHRIRDERVGVTRVINPGALHSPRQPSHPTVAVLDTDADTVEYIAVKR
jgi:putative phosphoesterase